MKAARTESDLESHVLTGPLADELAEARARAERVNPDPRPRPAPEPEPEPEPDPEPNPNHLHLIATLLPPGAHLLWARSTPTHAVWCERRAGKDRLRVIRVDAGKILAHWSFD